MSWSEADKIMKSIGVGWEIPNCASVDTRRYLFHLCRGFQSPTVLEIGTYLGVTTTALALGAGPLGRVLTVDLRDVMAPDGYWATEEDGEGRNLLGASPAVAWRHAGIDDRVMFVHSPAPQVLRWLRPRAFDLIFVDAWKDEEVVYQTLTGCLGLMKPGGVVVVHDVYPEGRLFREGITCDPGPWMAVERIRKTFGSVTGLSSLHVSYVSRLPTGGEDRLAEIRLKA